MTDSEECLPLLQNLRLELICFSCLDFYKKPVLLPCNHLFCSSCVPDSASLGSKCPLCDSSYDIVGIRRVYFLDAIVNSYRTIDPTDSAHILRLAIADQDGCVEKAPNSSRLKWGPVACGLKENECSQVTGSNPVRETQKESDDKLVAGQLHGSPTHIANNRNKKQSSALPEEGEVPLPPALANSDNAHVINVNSGALGSSDGQPTDLSEHLSGSTEFICGFCQTCKITEITGPMAHYANEKPVSVEEAACSDVVHAHSQCLEWAPRIYYAIRNLNKELSRGLKLKCSKCRLKGATLSCFHKGCRRDYHFPCAAEIPDCRWDSENYLLLCPEHASQKFPKEKSGDVAVEKRSRTTRRKRQRISREICVPSPSPSPSPSPRTSWFDLPRTRKFPTKYDDYLLHS